MESKKWKMSRSGKRLGAERMVISMNKEKELIFAYLNNI